MDVGTCGSELKFLGCEVCTLCADNTTAVEHYHVLLLYTKRNVELGTRDGCRTGTVHHDLDLRDILAVHLKGVKKTCGRDDCCTVLVVVHDRDIELLLEATLDLEALRRLDVLKVDTTECGGNCLHCLDELLGVLLIYLDIEYVYTCIYLEKESLTLHNGLARYGTDVTETKHGCTV